MTTALPGIKPTGVLHLATTFTVPYRQSDVPETFELATIFAAVAPKGTLNRAHAYKAAVAADDGETGSGTSDVTSSGSAWRSAAGPSARGTWRGARC